MPIGGERTSTSSDCSLLADVLMDHLVRLTGCCSQDSPQNAGGMAYLRHLLQLGWVLGIGKQQASITLRPAKEKNCGGYSCMDRHHQQCHRVSAPSRAAICLSAASAESACPWVLLRTANKNCHLKAPLCEITPACVLSCFSHVCLFAALWTVAHLALLSMEFSRQECCCCGGC